MMEVTRFTAFLVIFLAGLVHGNLKSGAAKEVLGIVNDQKLYNKEIIPYTELGSGPLEVRSTLFIRSLDIDDVNMRINVDLTFRMSWEDARLSYSVAGVPHVRFSEVSKFWIPDAFFKDSFKTEQMQTVHPESYIQISKKGEVLYSTRLLLTLKCPMDLSRFPHDDQICPMKFASYGYSTKDINFKFAEDEYLEFNENLILSDRFSLNGIDTQSCDSKTQTGEYSCLQVDISLDRMFGTYLLEWYLPCISLVLIAFLSEFLAVANILPRLIMTIGPLLTLTASSLYYSQSLASVPYATALDVFTGMSLLAIYMTVLHVIIGFYYNQKPAEEEKADVETATNWKRLYGKLKARGNNVARIVIISGYGIFIFLYFLAYPG